MTDGPTGPPHRRAKRKNTDATRAERNRQIVADRISGMT